MEGEVDDEDETFTNISLADDAGMTDVSINKFYDTFTYNLKYGIYLPYMNTGLWYRHVLLLGFSVRPIDLFPWK